MWNSLRTLQPTQKTGLTYVNEINIFHIKIVFLISLLKLDKRLLKSYNSISIKILD